MNRTKLAARIAEATTLATTLYSTAMWIDRWMMKKAREAREKNQTAITVHSSTTPEFFDAIKHWAGQNRTELGNTASIEPNGKFYAFYEKTPKTHSFEGIPITVCYNEEKKPRDAEEAGEAGRSFSVTLNTRDYQTIRRFFNEILQAWRETKKDKPTVSKWAGSTWSEVDSLPKRLPPILSEGIFEKLDSEIGWFLKNKGWFEARGIPYHRGYMLEGPPGTGKTSLIGAIAYKYGLNVLMPNLNSMDESQLTTALKEVKHGILVLEDIDQCTATHTREEPGDILDIINAPSGKLSLSGILNALDGIQTPQGLITIATTNKINHLDPALLRPGRMDKIITFKLPTRTEISQLCQRFELPIETSQELGAQWERDGISMATAQERLIEIALQHLGENS